MRQEPTLHRRARIARGKFRIPGYNRAIHVPAKINRFYREAIIEAIKRIGSSHPSVIRVCDPIDVMYGLNRLETWRTKVRSHLSTLDQQAIKRAKTYRPSTPPVANRTFRFDLAGGSSLACFVDGYLSWVEEEGWITIGLHLFSPTSQIFKRYVAHLSEQTGVDLGAVLPD